MKPLRASSQTYLFFLVAVLFGLAPLRTQAQEIAVTSATNAPFCIENNTGVRFTIFFSVANRKSGSILYTAYLSDAHGNFTASCPTLGSVVLNNQSNGIINNALIPVNTPAVQPTDPGYRIQVKASSYTKLVPSPFYLVNKRQNATVAIEARVGDVPTNTICAGAAVSFFAKVMNRGVNPGYTWYKNGQEIAGVTGATYSASNLEHNDKLTVRVQGLNCTNNGDVITSPAFTVSLQSKPTVTLSSFANACLNGGTVTLKSGKPLGGTYTINGVPATDFDPRAMGAGTHTIGYTYTTTGGCSATATQPITVISPTQTTWLGTKSSDWLEAGNWTSCIPDEGINTTIPLYSPSQARFVPAIRSGAQAKVKNLTFHNVFSLGAGAVLEIRGEVDGSEQFEVHPTSTIIYSGSATQTIHGQRYCRLVVKGLEAKVLNADVTVTEELVLEAGKIQLDSYNLTMDPGAIISGAAPDRYMVTNGTGTLRLADVGNGQAGFFPVGTLGGYTPATLHNTGTLDAFSMRVSEGVRAKEAYLTSMVVKKTWHLQEETVGGSVAMLRLQWNLTDEAIGFDRFQSFISQKIGETWARAGQAIGPASKGTGPNSFSYSQDNITTFSDFSIGSGENMPLPVQLSFFTAVRAGDDALLSWQTATEAANKGFGVEVSADGKRYRELAFVPSKGTHSVVKQSYAFRDQENGKIGTRYYRLRQVDQDGTVVYSGMKAVVFGEAQAAGVTVYPNPFERELVVRVVSERPQVARLVLTDAMGREVKSQQIQVETGVNQYQIRLAGSAQPGVYILTTHLADQRHHRRLIKKN